MAYKAFYREWRPQSFSEVVGQEHIVRTLQNALKANQIGHAYLFSGPRGTGKTSIAKILAKTVNCLNGPDIEPCNRCDHCLRITEGSFVDVLEIDAASNRGIDEIRDLKEKVRYLPAEGTYKVYIIDEVHMLTTEAFNALLKTLEEPPEHVIFLLATTEPNKLPATILSRCQRFDFRRLSTKEISDRLRTVADANSIQTNDGALLLISRYAEGAMRDALGLLEQAASFGDKSITEKDVLAILGVLDEEIMFKVAEALHEEDAGDMIRIVNDVINSGKDPKEFLNALIMHFRNLMLIKSLADPGDLVGMPDSSIEKGRLQAQLFSEGELLRIVDFLSRADNEIRWAVLPRILVETALLRLIGLGPVKNISETEERLSMLEREIARLKEIKFNYSPNNIVTHSRQHKAVDDESFHYDTDELPAGQRFDEDPIVMQIDDPVEDPLTLSSIKALWSQTLDITKRRSRTLHSFLTEGRPVRYENGCITLEFKFAIHKEQIEKRENRLVVEGILQEQYKEKVTVGCTLAGVSKTVNRNTGPIQHDEEGQITTEEVAEAASELDLFGGKIIDLSN